MNVTKYTQRDKRSIEILLSSLQRTGNIKNDDYVVYINYSFVPREHMKTITIDCPDRKFVPLIVKAMEARGNKKVEEKYYIPNTLVIFKK
jgi:hypothetical protein